MGESPRGIKAVDTASAPRNVAYAKYVKSEIAALDVKGPKFAAAPPLPTFVDRLGWWWDRWAPYLLAAIVVVLGLALARHRRERPTATGA